MLTAILRQGPEVNQKRPVRAAAGLENKGQQTADQFHSMAA